MSKSLYFIYVYDRLCDLEIYTDQMKLHKLLYFAKAYSFSIGEYGNFKSLDFQAWKNGPVVNSERNDIVYKFYGSIRAYSVYYKSRTDFEIPTESEQNCINNIIELLGDCSSDILSLLSHGEGIKLPGTPSPWEKNNPTGGISKKIISDAEIKKYYNKEYFDFLLKNKKNVIRRLNVKFQIF